MTPLDRALRRISVDLSEAGIDFALVGGLAVTVRGHERSTRDVDIAVAVSSDEGAESVIRALLGRGYGLESLLEHATTGRIATARMNAPKRARTTALIDLLFASTGIEPEIVEGAEALEVRRGFTIKVARLADLIAMKVLSRDDRRRPQDLMDLLVLVREASPEDLRSARDALRLIEDRGFHRRKHLVAELSRVVSSSRRESGHLKERPPMLTGSEKSAPKKGRRRSGKRAGRRFP